MMGCAPLRYSQMSASMREKALRDGELRNVPGSVGWFFALGRVETDLVFRDIHDVDGIRVFVFSTPQTEAGT